MRYPRRERDYEPEDGMWDARTKKVMALTFVFLAAGLLLSWEFGRIYNPDGKRPADAAAREEQFWHQIQFLNPGYPTELRKDLTNMGWRACSKFSAGWDATRVLSFLAEENGQKKPQEMPTPVTQVQFWMGVEQSAVLVLCPQHRDKIEGWMQNYTPKPQPPKQKT